MRLNNAVVWHTYEVEKVRVRVIYFGFPQGSYRHCTHRNIGDIKHEQKKTSKTSQYA